MPNTPGSIAAGDVRTGIGNAISTGRAARTTARSLRQRIHHRALRTSVPAAQTANAISGHGSARTGRLGDADGTEYALTGGFFSRSPGNIERVKTELEAGNVYINRGITGAMVARQPFGGFKMSGGGTKAGGRDYLLHFLLPRVVTENEMRRGFAPEATENQ